MLQKKPLNKKAQSILQSVIKYIEKEKRRLNMSTWGEYNPNIAELDSPCGTTACLAGTVLLVTKRGRDHLKKNNFFKDVELLKKEKNIGTNNYVDFPGNTAEVASKILGITEEEADRLFFVGFGEDPMFGWSEKDATDYREAKTAKERFKIFKRRVIKFIKTRK